MCFNPRNGRWKLRRVSGEMEVSVVLWCVSAMPRKREKVRKRNGCLNAVPVLEVNIGARRCGK